MTVREMIKSDISLIINYWLNSDEAHLSGMGVDVSKLPTEEQFLTYLSAQLELPIDEKQSYCVIWEKDGIPVGHSNTRPTVFGQDASMHLHLWEKESRSRGLGYQFIKLTLPYYFNNLQLKYLYCEPYALNPAPNKTIEKAGFELEREQITVPGAFNFEQATKRWCMSHEKFERLYKKRT